MTHVAAAAGEFVTERLATGDVPAAVIDVTVGLDPDLYPLLASSQTLTGGSNIAGVQDPALDKLLARPAQPGTEAERKAAYCALQKQLGEGSIPAPTGLRDEAWWSATRSRDPSVRQVADPADRFWDVLTWRLAADR